MAYRVYFKDSSGKRSWAFYFTLDQDDDDIDIDEVKEMVCIDVGLRIGHLKVYKHDKGRKLVKLYDGELNCFNRKEG